MPLSSDRGKTPSNRRPGRQRTPEQPALDKTFPYSREASPVKAKPSSPLSSPLVANSVPEAVQIYPQAFTLSISPDKEPFECSAAAACLPSTRGPPCADQGDCAAAPGCSNRPLFPSPSDSPLTLIVQHFFRAPDGSAGFLDG